MNVLLLIFSLVFNAGNADSTTPVTELSSIMLSASGRCVNEVRTAEKIYRAKEGYGIKFGTGSEKGRLVLGLDTTYTISTIHVTAAPYVTASGTMDAKTFEILGQTVTCTTADLTEYILSFPEPISTDSLVLSALKNSSNRFYVSRIDFEVNADPREGQVRITAPYSVDFGSLPIIDGEPAGDVQSVAILARNATDSLHLRLGSTGAFSLSDIVLPPQGGEVDVFFESSSLYASTNTLYVGDISVPLKASTYIPSSAMTDSIPCTLGYDYADNLKDEELKQAVGKIATCGIRYKYGSGTHKSWDGFYTTDRDTTNNLVLDMYSDNTRYFNPDKPTASVSGFDIEHRLPKSWWGGTVNRAYCDLYHLVPADYSANRSKCNHAPGFLTDTTFYNGSFATGYNKDSTDYPHDLRLFCPDDRWKGDFARTYFYIAVAYGDSLTWAKTSEPAQCVTNDSYLEFQPWLIRVLLQWHRMDSVSNEERERAEKVYRIQHNRNPFIDHPELVEYIWGEKKGQAYHFAPAPTGTQTIKTSTKKNRKTLHHGRIALVHEGKIYDIYGRLYR